MARLTLKQKHELRKQIEESFSINEKKDPDKADKFIDQVKAGGDVYDSAEKLLKAIADIKKGAPDSVRGALDPHLDAAAKIAHDMVNNPTSYVPRPKVSAKNSTRITLKTEPKAEKKEDREDILKT